jgi:hypothetical protein
MEGTDLQRIRQMLLYDIPALRSFCEQALAEAENT